MSFMKLFRKTSKYEFTIVEGTKSEQHKDWYINNRLKLKYKEGWELGGQASISPKSGPWNHDLILVPLKRKL